MTEKITLLRIQGKTCDGCASNVRKALRAVESVKDTKVELENETAIVVFDLDHANEDTLRKAVVAKGYRVD